MEISDKLKLVRIDSLILQLRAKLRTGLHTRTLRHVRLAESTDCIVPLATLSQNATSHSGCEKFYKLQQPARAALQF